MDTTATTSPHNGVAQFLRHFAPRRDDSSFLSPGRRSYASISKQRTRRTYSNAPTPHTDLVSPTSVVLPHFACESKVTTSTEGGMRLGISPTSYDIPGTLPSPLLISPKTDEEVVVFESDADPQFFPALFDSLSTWEEATKLELENVEPPSSPQKSVANSCGSHYSNSSGSIKSIRSSTMRIFGSRKSTDSMEKTKRKAKEIVNRSREKADSGGNGGWRRSLSPATTKSNDSSSSVGTNASESSRVKIFFLLLEPTTKVFELIQLVYPRKTTKVEDLLKMIPTNATEPALANQAYIGITRPKRRSEPVLDLMLWASNNLFSTTEETAGITHGEVIVAIPAYASASHIVSLAKQILASGHIQTLITKSSSESGNRSRNSSASPQRSQDADQVRTGTRSPSRSLKMNDSVGPASPRRSKERNRTHSNVHTPTLVVDAIRTSDGNKSSLRSPRRGNDRQISKGSTGSNHSCSSTQTGTSQSSMTPVSPEKHIAAKSTTRFQTFLTNQAVEVEPPAPPNLADTFYYGYGSTQSRPFHEQHCHDRHARATPFLSDNIFNGFSSVAEQRKHEVEFSGDMLNAYLSKDAVKNICEIVGDVKESTTTDLSPTYINDDLSLDDGSLTSSFQHWAQSLRDDTMCPEAEHGLAIGAGVLPSNWMGKKHFSTFLFRFGLFAFLSSLSRYYKDPAGMSNFETRHNVVDKPFGVLGLVQFISCFLLIVKLQKIVRGPVTGRPSRCPAMLLCAQLYESRYGRKVGQTCDY